MTRSAEALERRALKRNRTLKEQELADARKPSLKKKKRKRNKDVQERKFKQALEKKGLAKPSGTATTGTENATKVDCNNNDTAVNELPSYIPLPPLSTTSSSSVTSVPKHTNGSSSKKNTTSSSSNNNKKKAKSSNKSGLEWSKPQASDNQLEHNKELRRRYLEKDPTLLGEEFDRAKILVRRDERKKQKKIKYKQEKEEQVPEQQNGEHGVTDKKTPQSADKSNDSSSIIKGTAEGKQPPSGTDVGGTSTEEQNEADRALCKRYKKTKGDGMTAEEVKRAKDLKAAKKERKRQQKDAEQ